MEKITYGAPRLVDWVAQIKAGAATVRVHFTGGALTSYGVTPAEYTTANPFIQKVIEQSTYFKEGRIILLRRTALPDVAKPTKAAKPKPKAPAPNPQTVAPTPEAPAPAPAEVEAKVEEAKSLAPAPVPEAEQSAEEATASAEEVANDEAADGLTIVEASCLQDAQAYLQEQFNISSYKVRSYDAAQKAASEHGVKFVGAAKFDTLNGGESTESESVEE